MTSDGFAIPEDVMVVGIENPENFRWISRQKVFFKENLSSSSPLLFVSRYPQTQHGDLIRWLKAIPNRYVHFGDLDLLRYKDIPHRIFLPFGRTLIISYPLRF